MGHPQAKHTGDRELYRVAREDLSEKGKFEQSMKEMKGTYVCTWGKTLQAEGS